jgi:prophage regulatory protein
MSERILRIEQVCAKVGRSRSGLHQAIKAGKFVRPRQLGARAVGFLESEIDEWLRARPVADPETHHIVRITKQRKAGRDAQLQVQESF